MKRVKTILIIGATLLTACNFPGAASSQPVGTETALPLPVTQETEPADQAQVPEATATPTSTSPPTPSQTQPPIPEAPTPTHGVFPTPELLTSGEPVTITQIHMFDLLTGWGTGYQTGSGAHILTTEDGGQTWNDRTPPDPTAEMPDEAESVWAQFLDPLTAWVIYAPQETLPPDPSNLIWRTTDGGLTWEPSNILQVDRMESYFLPEGFAAFGSEHGWLLVHVGAGMSHDYSYLYATHDSGATWERVADPYGSGIQSLGNTGLAFANRAFGWVSKDNLGVMPGAFFEQTTDGGTSWEDVFLPAPAEHDWFNETSLCQTSAPTFSGEQTGLLIVKCRLYQDIQTDIEWSLTYVYTTRDRGGTWERARLPSPADSLLFLDDEFGWAFGRDHYQTFDGGLSWDLVRSVNWDGDFSFINQLNGWAVARNEGEIALVVTEDGGLSWQIIQPEMR